MKGDIKYLQAIDLQNIREKPPLIKGTDLSKLHLIWTIIILSLCLFFVCLLQLNFSAMVCLSQLTVNKIPEKLALW